MFFCCFLGSLKAQRITPQEVVNFWKHDDQEPNAQYYKIAKYVEIGLPDSVKYEYKEIAKILGANPDDKLRLYFEASKLQTQSFHGMHPNQSLLKQVDALLPLAARLNDKITLAWFYRFVGRVNYFAGEYERGIYYLKLSVDLYDQVGRQYHLPEIYSEVYYSLARALYVVKDYKECAYYAQRSLENLDRINTPKKGDFYIKSSILIYDLLGAAHKKSGSYPRAINYYQKILNTIQNNHLESDSYFKFWKGLTNGNMGQVYLDKGELQKALPFINIGLKASEAARDTSNIFEFKTNLAQIAYQKHNYSSALSTALEAQRIFKAYRFNINIRSTDLYRVLYQASLKLGKYEQAIPYLDKYKDLSKKDQIVSGNSQLKKVEVALKYNQLQQQEKEREIKINKLEGLRNFLIILVIFIMIVVWIVYRNYHYRQQKKLQVLTLENELKEKEVSTALRQIDNFKDNILSQEKLIKDLELKAEAKWRNTAELPEILQDFTLVTEKAWNKFRIDFITAYPKFLSTIRSRYSGLSQAEERLAILIFLKFDNEKIAHTLGISKESVAKSKRRLRTNLGFENTKSLEDYILTLV